MTETDRGRTPADDGASGESARRGPRLGLLIPIGIFAVVAIVFLFRIVGGHSEDVPSPLIGQAAPVFELPPLDGLQANGAQVPGFSNETLLGQVSLVNVWASWCGPCRDEHPFIERLAADDRFQVLGINHTDQTANALGFLDEFGNPYDAVGVDPRARVSIDWGVYGVPETFFVDRSGVIRYKLIGPINEERLQNDVLPQLEALLAEPTPGATMP
ncbi:MAG: DsbE family thiol:disulfide interchange protein [Bauldia sp.]